ncbi:hypothetical protein HMPREF0578_1924 [Mobiluncus mulieris 28-1]|uniref:AAA domain-containing protein n=2 Tax=Mobiluncus mulieris TaxID=2052 RepID=E0QSL1_9ACTO|nr:ATP-binding protein [Mobiluncus mulieris]EEZ90921.1 hypothetical protein HMPREF0578_1924 [Mobiluncus mulieris 28-1]EFM45461.1 hypothetical protein HMPREF0580_1876 [Mobiluncus mulieris ATCC 35239]MCU9995115.1 ATP-binding protein [Mobiluncus mulieris]MCV0014534.1 ATP-binding protein [Mobiluncus mulieris]NMW62602.1 ATP-binding protein [Mobiluncus mulieris]
MEFQRDAYLRRLISRKQNGLVKVVTGARRCGKSYLLFELFARHLLESGVKKTKIISVQLDDFQNRSLRDPEACNDYVRRRVKEQGQHYLLLDEVQLMTDFEDVLNGFLHIPNLDVYVTGSNSRFLSTDVITEFRGRGDEIRVHPLSFSEYHQALGGDWENNWNDYMTFGGMPYAATLSEDQDKTTYLQRLFQEIYLRDIVERYQIRNDGELSDLVDVVASTVGSLTNPTKLAHTFASEKHVSLSAPSIKKYLDYLEDAFIINHAKRYDVKGRKHIGSPLKYYFEDVGLRNARLNFRQQEPTHLMENTIYNELIARGFSVDIGIVEQREKGARKQIEIDFIANQGSKRYYLQSAFALPDAAKREQEKRPLVNTDDSFKKIIVVGGNPRLSRDEKGIVTIGIKEFLLNPGSLDL